MVVAMILTIDNLLDQDELAWLRGLFDELGARPGHDSAGADVKAIKTNLELDLGGRIDEVRGRLVAALNRHPFLTHALLPRTVSRPILSIYETGMYYGNHNDSAVGVNAERHYRADISVTIFIDDPDHYLGGELAITTDTGEQAFKPDAGSAVFYPTHYLHRVNAVSGGRRRAAVMWFESMIRDPIKRSILFELSQVRGWLNQHEPIESEPRQRMIGACENLYRMWLET